MAELLSSSVYGNLAVTGEVTVSGAVKAPSFEGPLSGNAGTATKLTTPRKINGVDFDGSSNITTANWGTSRNFTVGATTKAVNGSGNVSFTLNEIGTYSKQEIDDKIDAGGITLDQLRTIFDPDTKQDVVTFHDSDANNTLNLNNGACQRWAPTGTVTLAISNWPAAGTLGQLMIEGVNLGAANITWPTVQWIKNDGTTATTLVDAGVELQTTGIDWIMLWTRDGGSTVYGKVMR